MGQDVVLVGRNELPKNGTNYANSKASVNSKGSLNVSMTDSNGTPLLVDPMTNTLSVIDIHAKTLHDGNTFYLKGYQTLTDTEVFRVKLTTPADKDMHFSFMVQSVGKVKTYFDEGAAGGMTGGAGVTPLNRNRNSTSTSGAVLTAGVTASTGYDMRIVDDAWGAESNKILIGGGGGVCAELMLKRNTTYLRTFESESDSNIIQYEACWSEMEDLT